MAVREPLRQSVIVASDGGRVRVSLYLAEAGKSLQLASASIDLAAARVAHEDLGRILARAGVASRP